MLYTDCQSGKTAAISRHVSFAQITCFAHLEVCSVWGEAPAANKFLQILDPPKLI